MSSINPQGYEYGMEPHNINPFWGGEDGDGIWKPELTETDDGYVLSWTKTSSATTPEPIEIHNGEPGEPGQNGTDGTNGTDGADGITPDITATASIGESTLKKIDVTKTGTEAEPNFNFEFNGMETPPIYVTGAYDDSYSYPRVNGSCEFVEDPYYNEEDYDPETGDPLPDAEPIGYDRYYSMNLSVGGFEKRGANLFNAYTVYNGTLTGSFKLSKVGNYPRYSISTDMRQLTVDSATIQDNAMVSGTLNSGSTLMYRLSSIFKPFKQGINNPCMILPVEIGNFSPTITRDSDSSQIYSYSYEILCPHDTAYTGPSLAFVKPLSWSNDICTEIEFTIMNAAKFPCNAGVSGMRFKLILDTETNTVTVKFSEIDFSVIINDVEVNNDTTFNCDLSLYLTIYPPRV